MVTLKNGKAMAALYVTLYILGLMSCQTNHGDKKIIIGLIPTDASSYVLLNAYLDRELCRGSLVEAGLSEALVPRVDQVIIAQKLGEDLTLISGDLPASLVKLGLKNAGFEIVNSVGTFEIYQNMTQGHYIALIADNVLLSSNSKSAIAKVLTKHEVSIGSMAYGTLAGQLDRNPILFVISELPRGAPFASFALNLDKNQTTYGLKLVFGTLSPGDSKSQAFRSIVRFAAISVFGAFSSESSTYELGSIEGTETSIETSAQFTELDFSFKKLNDLVQGFKL